MTDQSKQKVGWLILRVVFSVIASVAVIGGAAYAVYEIYQSEPTAEREGATRKSAALVETVQVSRGTYTPEIVVLGNVQPAREIELSPRVSGEVIEVHPEFTPGGVIKEKQLLLEIDPADLKFDLRQRQEELKQKKTALVIEQGRQTVARKEFESLGEEIDPKNKALVLREPQIAAIEAEINAAKTAIGRVKLDLKRTQIKAPFDAHILARYANRGSQVTAGQRLARLVGTDEYWIMAMVPLRNLNQIAFPVGKTPGSTVAVRLNQVWDADEKRQGTVTRLVGDVDPQARMAKVLITIKDPLSLESDGRPLLLGTLVEARIQGKAINDVVRLPRAYLRKNDTVWVMAEGKLAIRQAQVVFRDSDYVYIRDGLKDGDEVVITTLSSVSEGSALRKAGETDELQLDVEKAE